jgi:hypothetical protein
LLICPLLSHLKTSSTPLVSPFFLQFNPNLIEFYSFLIFPFGLISHLNNPSAPLFTISFPLPILEPHQSLSRFHIFHITGLFFFHRILISIFPICHRLFYGILEGRILYITLFCTRDIHQGCCLILIFILTTPTKLFYIPYPASLLILNDILTHSLHKYFCDPRFLFFDIFSLFRQFVYLII